MNHDEIIARISKSKKLGILKRHQKTWSFPTVAPKFTLNEMMPSVEAEAKRWEEKVLKSLTPTPPALAGLPESSLLPTLPAA